MSQIVQLRMLIRWVRLGNRYACGFHAPGRPVTRNTGVTRASVGSPFPCMLPPMPMLIRPHLRLHPPAHQWSKSTRLLGSQPRPTPLPKSPLAVPVLPWTISCPRILCCSQLRRHPFFAVHRYCCVSRSLTCQPLVPEFSLRIVLACGVSLHLDATTPAELPFRLKLNFSILPPLGTTV